MVKSIVTLEVTIFLVAWLHSVDVKSVKHKEIGAKTDTTKTDDTVGKIVESETLQPGDSIKEATKDINKEYYNGEDGLKQNDIGPNENGTKESEFERNESGIGLNENGNERNESHDGLKENEALNKGNDLRNNSDNIRNESDNGQKAITYERLKRMFNERKRELNRQQPLEIPHVFRSWADFRSNFYRSTPLYKDRARRYRGKDGGAMDGRADWTRRTTDNRSKRSRRDTSEREGSYYGSLHYMSGEEKQNKKLGQPVVVITEGVARQCRRLNNKCEDKRNEKGCVQCRERYLCEMGRVLDDKYFVCSSDTE